jgi:hypothetical protein
MESFREDSNMESNSVNYNMESFREHFNMELSSVGFGWN